MTPSKPTIGFAYSSTAQTPYSVVDLIKNISRGLSQFEVVNLNVSSPRGMMFRGGIQHVDLWLLHNSATYRASRLEQLLAFINRNSQSIPIVVMKQDDYLEPYLFDRIFCQTSVVGVFTYLSPGASAIVYPNSHLAGVKFKTMHTAYVTPWMMEHRLMPLPQTLAFTYRGGHQPVTLGQLARDKALLPGKIRHRSRTLSPWVLDFSTRPKDRLYGLEWEQFIDNSYAMFSTESGSRAFDLDGSLAARTLAFERKHGQIDWRDECLAELYMEQVLSDYEENVDGGSFAPRNIELACWGRPQVLVDGNYGGLFIDGENASFVRRDLANLPEVLRGLESRDYAYYLSQNARRGVLENPSLQIRSLLQLLTTSIEEFLSLNSLPESILSPPKRVKTRNWLRAMSLGGLAILNFEFRSIIRQTLFSIEKSRLPFLGRLVSFARRRRTRRSPIF